MGDQNKETQTIEDYRKNDIIRPSENQIVFLQSIERVSDVNIELVAGFCNFYFKGIKFRTLPSKRDKLNINVRKRDKYDNPYYNTAEIINAAVSNVRPKEFARIFTTKKYLTHQNYNWLFGHAFPSKQGYAVCSYAKFPKKDNIPRIERFTKLVIHEVAHLLGISHCPNPKCIMAASGGLKSADNRHVYMCDRDREKLRIVCNHDKKLRLTATKAVWNREIRNVQKHHLYR